MDSLRRPGIQDLEDSGFLDQLRAELRARLFKAAELHESKAQISRPATSGVLSNELGQICASLIKDFLESFKLSHSLSVFVPECHLAEDRGDIEELEQMFQVQTEMNKPLLFSVIEYLLQNAENQENSQELIGTPSDAEEAAGGGADSSAKTLVLQDFDHIEAVRRSREKKR